MGRNLYHSAEGSHWTKKNHKYIRKEGNRYIYPEDVNKGSKTRTARDVISDRGLVRVDHVRVPELGIHDNRVETYKPKHGTQQKLKFDSLIDNHRVRFTHRENDPNTNGARGAKFQQERNNQAIGRELKQENAINNQRSADYKKLSEQHANRQAAKSGKVVNPTYTLRDDQGNKVMRLQSKDKLSTPTVADYKKFSQQRANREAAKNGVKEIYQFDDGSSWREYGRSTQEFAKDNGRNKIKQMRQKKALNQQGSNSMTSDSVKKVNQERRRKEAAGASNLYVRNQDDAKRISKLRKETSDWILQDGKDVAFTHEDVRPGKNGGRPKVFKTYELRSGYSADAANRQKNAQRKAEANIKSYDYAKEQDNWNQSNPGTTRAKKKLATYRQGNSLFADDSPYTKKHVTKEMAQRTDEFDKDLNRRKYANSAKESNKEIIKNTSNKLKKKGYFTVQNGKTVFVPSDDITMKKVSKGRQLVDKIKSKFSKKK